MNEDQAKQDIAAATAKVDPLADKLLVKIAGSAWTPWIIVGWTVACIAAGKWLL